MGKKMQTSREKERQVCEQTQREKTEKGERGGKREGALSMKTWPLDEQMNSHLWRIMREGCQQQLRLFSDKH